MDPSIINEASFSAANPSSYSLAELWPFSTTGGAGGSGSGDLAAGLGLRMGSFGSFGGGDVSAVSFNESSSVTEQSGGGGGGERKRKDACCVDEASQQLATTSNANALNDSTAKQTKALIATQENGDSKAEGEGNKATEQSIKPEPPKDYIHVRARRGQAKDSHSLAERARREKISERMRILQDLVPGCNKVIGKALVLDEIINYIQSLQRQVEFLSMKLEAVNSKMGPVIEGFHPKEFAAPTYSTGMLFGPQAARQYEQGGTQSEWLHMQVGGSFERTA